MNREQRLKYAGIFFYIIMLLSLSASPRGRLFINNNFMSDAATLKDIYIPLVTAAAILFTSESIGFIFNSIFVFIWNLRGGLKPEDGGYAAEWKNLKYNYKERFISQCNEQAQRRFASFGADVLFSYFWQQAPNVLVEWVSRRHTAFFSGMSAVVSIACSIMVSFTTNLKMLGGLTMMNWAIYVGSLLCAGLFYYNAIGARRESWQMIDLWSHGSFDPTIAEVLNKMQKSTNSSSGPSSIYPSFRLLRRDDLKERNTVNDHRRFYFDNDVDIVHTVINKKHTEPKHFHKENIEIYLVESGEMTLIADDKSIHMSAGDLAVVYPNVCHSFETVENEVRFLAIKKFPGLKDKMDC